MSSVNHPSHYNQISGIECIDNVTKLFTITGYGRKTHLIIDRVLTPIITSARVVCVGL